MQHQAYTQEGMTSPHSSQASNPSTDIPFQRLLLSSAPMSVYNKRAEGEVKSVIHWGQRKLLMSEIEFLLRSQPRRCVVIYAGAAPGTHVQILSDMFPMHRFILVDPSPFTVKSDGDRIITHQCMFTNELAHDLRREYADAHLLFISDVRSSDFERESTQENEKRIRNDMNAQAEWHKILAPVESMLKFRLPYTQGDTTYLKGEIFLPVWGPQSTTECRLVVKTDAELQIYNHTEHEQRMFHFNKVTRPALYPHGVRGWGIDHCYDCTAEVNILRDLLGIDASDDEIARKSAYISRSICRNRTLADPTPDPVQRKRVIRRKQWTNGRPSYE
jgi:cap2 methyltransferase